MQQQVERIIQQITQWAASRETILAVALVGSWARGTATANSDIDLMFLTQNPLLYKRSADWLSEIDWSDRQIDSWEDKTYGAVWSRHVRLKDEDTEYCIEVEFSFGQLDWTSITPLDAGTERVVKDGCRILYDPQNRLTQLVQFVSQ